MNKWFIAIKKRNDTSDLFDLGGYSILESPAGHYWADPFLASHNGRDYLFFEDYDYSKGLLAVGELFDTPEGGIGIKNVRTVLEEPQHISFPSVTKIDGQWYMTPESVLNGKLRVFKALQFPDVWEQVCVVARGRYDDPILRKEADGFYIYTNEDGDKIRVFHSKTLTDDWMLRRSYDQQYSRRAGHFIGDIEPLQDSLPDYGKALVFKKNGHIIKRIEPDWIEGLTGTHTFNANDKYVVWDGRIKLND